jgi:hypothetical protein
MGYYGTEASSLGSEYPCKRQRSVAYCVERTLSTLVGIVRFKADYLLVLYLSRQVPIGIRASRF